MLPDREKNMFSNIYFSTQTYIYSNTVTFTNFIVKRHFFNIVFQIQKHPFQYSYEIVNTCFLATTCIMIYFKIFNHIPIDSSCRISVYSRRNKFIG